MNRGPPGISLRFISLRGGAGGRIELVYRRRSTNFEDEVGGTGQARYVPVCTWFIASAVTSVVTATMACRSWSSG